MKDRNTTWRRKTDSEMLENLEMFGSLYENLPLGYQSLDSKGNFIIINQTWLDLLGYSNKEEIVGKNFGDFITERDLFAERFPKFKSSGIAKEVLFEMIRKDGTHILVSIDGRVSYDKDGNFIQTHCVLHDVTEKHKMDEALKESEARYRLLFTSLPYGWAYHKIIVDKNNKPIDYVFLEVNDAFEKLSGLKREEILGNKVTEVLPGIEKDPADWIGRYGEVALTGKGIKFENYSEAIGKWFSVTAFRPKKGYFIVIFDDITERKKMEDKLKARTEELERINRVFVGRELKMKELKKEIEELKKKSR